MAAVLGVVGATLLAMGLGLGVAPAQAGTGHDTVTPSVSFHNPDCNDKSAGWTGYVDGHAASAGDGVRFAVSGGTVAPGHSVTITATAEAGFTFSGGGTTRTFDHTYTDTPNDCGSSDIVVTASVVFHNPDSQDQSARWAGFVNGHADTAGDGVTFAVTAGTVAPGHTVTITATAEAGFVFPNGDKTKTFCHTFTAAPGGQVVTVTPTVEFNDQTTTWAGFVNGQPDSANDHVTFEVTAGTVAPGDTVTITATAEAGFVFPNGETTATFTHHFTASGSGGGGTGSGSGSGSGGAGSGSAGTGSGVSGTTAVSGSAAAGAHSGSSAQGVLGSQSALPTSVEAGLAGNDQTAIPLGIAALMLGGGTLLVLASGWITIRKPRAGAHRA